MNLTRHGTMRHGQTARDGTAARQCAPRPVPVSDVDDLSRGPWGAAGGPHNPAGGPQGHAALTPRASCAAADGPCGAAGGCRGAAAVKAVGDFMRRNRGKRGGCRRANGAPAAPESAPLAARSARFPGESGHGSYPYRPRTARRQRRRKAAVALPLPWLDRPVAGRFAANPENQTPLAPPTGPGVSALLGPPASKRGSESVFENWT